MNGTFTLNGSNNDEENENQPTSSSSERLNFFEAHEKKFIYNPMTLKECDDSELILKDNRIKNVIKIDDGKEEEEKGEQKSHRPLECLSESPRMSLGSFLEASWGVLGASWRPRGRL